MSNTAKSAADYILPLNINGLSGRMLRIPPKKDKRREILYVYGHHSSLERTFGVALFLNRYGGVTVPDLPGFGGMEPFYKINEKPTLDNLADYLATFIMLRFKKKRLTIAGLSLGSVIVTRMLQKHPEITKKVDLFVSFAGFTHKKDFVFKKHNYWLLHLSASALSLRIPAALAKFLFIRTPVIKSGYYIGEKISFNAKLAAGKKTDRSQRINFEVHLWKCNDLRTYMSVGAEMLKIDLTNRHAAISVHNVYVKADHYVDRIIVEQHMRMIFSGFSSSVAKAPVHSPSVIATAKEAAPYITSDVRRLLNKKVP